MDAPNDMSFTVTEDEAGQRLDRLCAEKHPAFSRNQIQILNEGGGIAVDGVARRDSYRLSAGEYVEIRPSLVKLERWDEGARPVPQYDVDVPVVYEDDDIVVVNKPAGLVVHPAHGNPSGTLVNGLIGRGIRLADLGGPHRPGVVHRLDKDTSGLMVVAKTDAAYRKLVAMLKVGRVRKEYHAIVHGNLGKSGETIRAPIGRHPLQRKKMAVLRAGGKDAVTQLFVVDRYSHFDYIRVAIYTGRTHQIRVHMSHVSHPLLGDPVYGGRPGRRRTANPGTRAIYEKLSTIMVRHALHASLLSFSHPVSERTLTFRTALPEDMRLALEMLYIEDRIKED